MKNQIYIRVDANPMIGMGHLMRCLSIADAINQLQKYVIIILSDSVVSSTVSERGYDFVILDTDYSNLECELDSWPDVRQSIVIVDSYYVTRDYLLGLKKRVGEKGRLVYIDDLASFAYPVDLLINYNLYSMDIDYSKMYYNSEFPELMIGPIYAPLRRMFQRGDDKQQQRTINNVLISTGGADVIHLALRFVKAKPRLYTYHLLIGALNPDKEEIRRIAGDNIVLHENESDMQKLISSCDIAVSAAGSTMYEICSCGIPLITYVAADNQVLGACVFEREGLAINCGDFRKDDCFVDKILNSVTSLADNYELRCDMSRKMRLTVDGFGSDRLAKGIIR